MKFLVTLSEDHTATTWTTSERIEMPRLDISGCIKFLDDKDKSVAIYKGQHATIYVEEL